MTTKGPFGFRLLGVGRRWRLSICVWMLVCVCAGLVWAERYTFQIGDTFQVFNYGYPDLSQSARVGPDGMADIKLIGPIRAVGLTPEKLGQMVQDAYIRFAPESRITIIREDLYPQIAHLMGEVTRNGPIDLTYTGQIPLIQAISASGGFTEKADISRVLVMKRDQQRIQVDFSPLLERGEAIEIPLLEVGDTVVVLRKYDRRVYVLGTAGKNGPIHFEDQEPFTLNNLISKVGFNPDLMDSEVLIYRDDQKLTIDLASTPVGRGVALSVNDIVIIHRIEERFVYAVGVGELSGRIDFGLDEQMTISSMLGKLGLKAQSLSELQLWLALGNQERIDPRDGAMMNRPLVTGTIVEFPASKYVYALGDIPAVGKVSFSDEEPLTLLTLMSKLGLPIRFPISVRLITESGQIYQYTTEQILSRDVFLQSGSIVEFPHSRYVYVTGDYGPGNAEDGSSQGSGRIVFGWDESMTLRTALTKINAISADIQIKVDVVRGADVYTFQSQSVFNSSTQFEIQTGDIIYTEKNRQNYVYLIEQGEMTSKIAFAAHEPMTLFQLLIKMEEISQTADRHVQIISPNGVVRVANLDEVLHKKKAVPIEPLSVIILPQTDRKVYVLGNAEKWGEILFRRDEPFTLRQLMIKAKADLSTDTESVIIYEHGKVTRYPLEEILAFEKDIPLVRDQLVYFQPYRPVSVSVFGQVRSPGVKLFDQGETPSLMMALAKSEGFMEGASRKLKIIAPDGKITHVDYDQLHNPGEIILEDQSYIVVDPNWQQMVVVLGDVVNPGIKTLRTDSSRLVEILAMSGGVLDWGVNTTIEITRIDGMKQWVDTGEDPGLLTETKVNKGDIVYVVPSSKLRVYVFGEVAQPGIVRYRPKMTLLEAVLSSGGPTDSAYLSKVLHFPGGISNNPVIVDLDVIRSGRASAEVYLQPGDVVYVPKSAMVDILQVVTFLGRMISFVDSGVSLYNKLQ